MCFLCLCALCLLLIRESLGFKEHGGVTGSKNRSPKDEPPSSKRLLMRAEIFSPPLSPLPRSSHSLSSPRLCSSTLLLLFFLFALPSPLLSALPFFFFSLFPFPLLSPPLSPHLLSVYRQACTSPPAVIYSA